MTDVDPQVRINRAVWQRGGFVGEHANRRLLPVEVVLLARYREALAGRVLDAGCGAGRVLGYLVALGGEVSGIDISPEMVAHCHAAFPDIDVRIGDLADLGAATDGRYSAIVAMANVLDIFDDSGRRHVLGQIAERLTDAGILIFSSHNLAYLDARHGGTGGLAGRRPAPRLRQLAWKAGSRPLGDVAKKALAMPRQILNRRRLGPLQRVEPGYEIVNDSAHDYALLHYYIRRDVQERQLSELGYRLVECLDVDGDPVGKGSRARRRGFTTSRPGSPAAPQTTRVSARWRWIWAWTS